MVVNTGEMAWRRWVHQAPGAYDRFTLSTLPQHTKRTKLVSFESFQYGGNVENVPPVPPQSYAPGAAWSVLSLPTGPLIK